MVKRRSTGSAHDAMPGRRPSGAAKVVQLAGVFLFAAASSVSAASLYKSIARDGGITYSDAPQAGAITVEEIVIARGASGPGTDRKAVLLAPPSAAAYSDPRSQADTRISRANADLDTAEYALAQARRPLWAVKKGLINADLRMSSDVDYTQIDILKSDVAAARRALVEAINQRNSFH